MQDHENNPTGLIPDGSNSVPARKILGPDLIIPKLILGSESEHKTEAITIGQFQFPYEEQDLVVLEELVDQDNRFFLHAPGYHSWVFGNDYGFDPIGNALYFLHHPPRTYRIGGDVGYEIMTGTILWAFYHVKNE